MKYLIDDQKNLATTELLQKKIAELSEENNLLTTKLNKTKLAYNTGKKTFFIIKLIVLVCLK